VHVRKDGRDLARYDLETDAWMEIPAAHLNTATEAVREWRRKHGY